MVYFSLLICNFQAGLIRGSKNWTFAQMQSAWSFIGPILDKSLNNSTVELLSEWNDGVRFATYNMDVRRLAPLIGKLWKLKETDFNHCRSSFYRTTQRSNFICPCKTFIDM